MSKEIETYNKAEIRYIKKWYLFYYEEITKLQQVAAELKMLVNQNQQTASAKLYRER